MPSKKRQIRPRKAVNDNRRGNGGAKPRRRGRLARRLLAGVAWTIAILGAGFIWFTHDLPDVGTLAEPGRGPSITLLAADGTRIARFGSLYGEPVQLDGLPSYLPQAVLATEDRRFYDHPGVDLLGILRAMVANVRAGGIVQGGSTITQQLAKNLFLGPERTLHRKVQEALLAIHLEQRFTKDEILTIYLNRVYFGAGAYGVEAAAVKFFGKPAAEVSLYEAAMLAGLLKAPSRYNPARNTDLAATRAAIVLDNMVAAGFLDAPAAAQAKVNPVRGTAGLSGWGSRHFADWVLELVPGFVGTPQRDLTVVTTLDPRLQRLAEEKLAALLATDGAAAGASQAALVTLAPDGAVRAMVGGRDYGASQFNRVTQALRQPGSAFKLFVYLAGLEAGLGPDSRMVDGPLAVGDWRPGNYSNNFAGEMSLREALARSVNTVAVQVSERAGRDRVISVARRLGITSNLHDGPSIALGTAEVTLLELTQAYATLANAGEGVWSYAIREVRDDTGAAIYRRAGSGPGVVLAPAVVAAITDMLGAAIAEGTGRAADIGRPAAGKTGTSQDYRDAWFVGFTAELATGVWLGNDDGGAMNKVTGGGLPARLWRDFMAAALVGTPAHSLPGTLFAAQSTAGGVGSMAEDAPASLPASGGVAAPAQPSNGASGTLDPEPTYNR